MAVLLASLQDRLLARVGGRPSLAAAVLDLLTPLVIFLPLFWLGAEFIEQGRTLIDGMQHSNWRIDGSLVSRLGDYPVLGGAVTWLTETLDLDPTEITGFLVTLGQTLLRYAASFGSQMVLGALNTTLAFLRMLFLLYFILRDGRHFLACITHLLPIDHGRREHLFILIDNTPPRRGVRVWPHSHFSRDAHGDRLCPDQPALSGGVRRSRGTVIFTACGWNSVCLGACHAGASRHGALRYDRVHARLGCLDLDLR